MFYATKLKFTREFRWPMNWSCITWFSPSSIWVVPAGVDHLPPHHKMGNYYCVVAFILGK